MIKFPFFTGDRSSPITESEQAALPASRFQEETNPENYTTDPDLVNAANVAILMGKPLLLTGEPGTGKTQFAARLAWELGRLPLLKFETKSTSKSSDLFYYFNMVGYFQSAQTGNVTQAQEFITYNALGEAILRTRKQEEYAGMIPAQFLVREPQRSIVLIDEIDKAPRDFPNDILNELEGLYFRIPELGNLRIGVEPTLAPFVIITSNSERNLPETFLRRCIFHHIEFPKEIETLNAIVRRRLGATAPSEPAFSQMTALFTNLRENQAIDKKPTIGELLLWMQAIRRLSLNMETVEISRELIFKTFGIIIKSKNDQQAAASTITQWLQKNNL